MSAHTSPPDVSEATREAFVSYMDQFVTALVEVFPECQGLKAMRLEFDVGITHAMSTSLKATAEKKLIDDYNEAMSPYYEACQKRDDSVFLNNEIKTLRSIDMQSKWMDPSVDNDTKECVWSYVDNLNKYCQMYFLYKSVPDNMMNKIQNVAMGLAEKIEGGEINLADLNIAQLGQSVVGEIDREELEQFAQDMMSNQQNIMSLTSMLGGNGMPPFPNMSPGPGSHK